MGPSQPSISNQRRECVDISPFPYLGNGGQIWYGAGVSGTSLTGKQTFTIGPISDEQGTKTPPAKTGKDGSQKK